jgi:hypothetical protein
MGEVDYKKFCFSKMAIACQYMEFSIISDTNIVSQPMIVNFSV